MPPPHYEPIDPATGDVRFDAPEPTTKSLHQLSADLSVEMQRAADVIDEVLEGGKTRDDPGMRTKLTSAAGFLRGASEGIKTWPQYFTSKRDHV